MAGMDGHKDMYQTSSTKLTYDDFMRFPDDGQRHELIDGVHYVTPSPATPHQRVSRDLLVALADFLRHREIGLVFAAPFDVVLSFHDIVEPDLLVILVDPKQRTIVMSRRGEDSALANVESLVADRGDRLTSPLLPGFSVSLLELFSSSAGR